MSKQARQDEIAARRQQVALLRMTHMTQEQIANRLGVSIGTVNNDLQAIRAEWSERRTQGYDSWVSEEVAKLDSIEQAWLPKALKGDDKAVSRVLAIMDRRSKLLGLDQPERHEHTVLTMDAIDKEIERLTQQVEERAKEAEVTES